jgi:hypothetical protein
MTTDKTTSWSASQALSAIEHLTVVMTNQMVRFHFDDTEKEALQVLREKAMAGYRMAVDEVAHARNK